MSEHQHDTRTPSPFTRPRFVIAAVAVALITVFALALLLTRPDTPATAPPVATGTSTPTSPASSTAPATGGGSVCGLKPGDQNVPVTAPKNTEWELVGTVAAPTAPDTIGPGETDGGLRTCFAHSPEGVLYAAVSIVATTTLPDEVTPMLRSQAAKGPGRDAAIAALKATPPSPPKPGALQVAGFSFLSYDRESAVVDLALRSNTGGYGHTPIAMRWEDGDWKVVVPPDGNLAGAVQQLPNLTGYAPWAGA